MRKSLRLVKANFFHSEQLTANSEQGMRDNDIFCNFAKNKIMAVQSYRDLIVWQKGMDLVTNIYQIVRSFPPIEQYGLTSQICRAAVSIPSNIAEGHGRNSINEMRHFLSIARGSLVETQTQIEIAYRLGYVSKDEIQHIWALQEEIGKMLWSMLKKGRI